MTVINEPPTGSLIFNNLRSQPASQRAGRPSSNPRTKWHCHLRENRLRAGHRNVNGGQGCPKVTGSGDRFHRRDPLWLSRSPRRLNVWSRTFYLRNCRKRTAPCFLFRRKPNYTYLPFRFPFLDTRAIFRSDRNFQYRERVVFRRIHF